MAVEVYEKWDSRESTEGENASAELRYVIRGTDSDIAAKAALASAAPLLYDGLVRQSYQIERIGEDIWEGTVQFGRRKAPETGESVFQFDTGGGTQHITQSIQTVGRYAPPGKIAPDFYGAIGVTKDSVEGVDIVVPAYAFSEIHYLPTSAVTQSYKCTLAALTGKVNNSSFRGFAAGEVLFLGASGSKRGEEDWEITFRFQATPNVTGLQVGNITGINKKGWEYLWVRYDDEVDNSARTLVKRPAAVYVEQVYQYADFSLLGIGT